MKNKINKIIKLIENLEISGSGWDESGVFSPILEIILKKQNFKYEEPYQFYHQIHTNLYKNCQTCKSKCKTSYKTHCIVCQNHVEELSTCYSCGDVICAKCCPFNNMGIHS